MNNILVNNIESLNYEFSQIPYEYYLRQKQPFPYQYTPPFEGYPLDGVYNPPTIPQGPPPNYVPSKNDKGIQSFKNTQNQDNIKSVSQNSISFCLYKYTYIWEYNGRSYWTFLLNVNRNSISGFRWLGRNWVYFGLDLKRIDSFLCYRSDIFCENCNEVNNESISEHITKKEYYLSETRDVYTEILISINIPEVKDDYKREIIGYVDDTPIQSQIPCSKYRVTNYKLLLEVSYPSNIDEEIKEKIAVFTKDDSINSYNLVVNSRVKKEYYNPLQIFNKSIDLIPEILKTFKISFNQKFEKLGYNKTNIFFSIKEEIFCNNWSIFNKNSNNK